MVKKMLCVRVIANFFYQNNTKLIFKKEDTGTLCIIYICDQTLLALFKHNIN